MTERDSRIGELYEAALKKPIGERASFVAARAGGDEDLRRRVEALLAGQQDTALPGYESAAGSSTVLATGTQIGSYRIDGPLGAGGMGVVYRATDTKLNRPAAIKVLPENLADPEARRRFQREAQMVSSLNHPHIVTLYDAGEYLERQYLITEYVDGGTLRQWAARPRGWRPIVELLIGVADGIATAHDAGILHRDIKPENILLAKNGYAKLADFGIAKLFEADPFADDPLSALRADGKSSLIGTAAYMSPEQAQGLPLDARSDVYSFGLVLYELLAGSRPFAGREAGQPRGAAEPIPPLGDDVPAELRTIVAKALEHELADRYQTMRELVIDLRRVARRSGIDARDAAGGDAAASAGARTGPIPPPRSSVRRVGYIVAGVVALLAIAILVARQSGMLLNAPAEGSVAVLPFANETADANDAHISEGLGDTLRDRLMELPGLSVQARASSVSFRDQNVSPPTIAASLGVNTLINGSFRRDGENLSVLVELVNASGFAIRSFRHTRPEHDLLKLQQEIAADVTAFLVPASEAPPAATAAVPTTESESANMLVLFGSHYEDEVRDDLSVDEEKLQKAIDFYSRATVADPTSISAHSRLAGAYLYLGEVEKARAPLAKALELGKSIDLNSTSAELSETYYSMALYLLRTRSEGIETAYKIAIHLNPNNADALGSYALWLMTHGGGPAADGYFRQALELDRQNLLRYVDYATYLGIIEKTDELLALASTIEGRFPNARGYRALARLHEDNGDIDVGIAWGLKAHRLQPNDADTKWQIAELYARIGEWDKAAEYEPEPSVNLLYFRQRYNDLVDLSSELMFDQPEDLNLKYMLAFGYNATGDFAHAKGLLELMGLPSIAQNESATSADDQAMTTYIDALQSLGENARATELAQLKIDRAFANVKDVFRKSWWVHSYRACTFAELGEVADALDELDGINDSRGLALSPFIKDSPCFHRKILAPAARSRAIADEPRYIAVVEHLEERQRMLRERLPATLREHGVADVRAAAAQ